MVVGKGSLPHAVPHSAVITFLWRNGLGSFYCGAGGMHGGKWLCISDQERPAGSRGPVPSIGADLPVSLPWLRHASIRCSAGLGCVLGDSENKMQWAEVFDLYSQWPA